MPSRAGQRLLRQAALLAQAPHGAADQRAGHLYSLYRFTGQVGEYHYRIAAVRAI